jgi:uncharacterized membrane protein SirB2
MYLILLAVHMSCAALSISFFLLRGVWVLQNREGILNHPVVKVAPHIIDTVLLLSALSLTLVIGQYPFLNNWLTVKFFAVIGYIVLGSIALKRGRTHRTRGIALGSAALLFGYIVSVAYYHHPMGIFKLLSFP